MNFGNLFNLDNPVWKVLGLIWDAIWLTILWAVSSVLIVTIGPATSALYSVAMKLVKGQEGVITKQFFEVFARDFKQSFVTGIVMLLAGGVLGYNFYYWYNMGNSLGNTFMISTIIFSYILLMIGHYIFAVIARFSNTLPNLFVMAFMMSVKNFGWTLLMITVTASVALLAIFAFWPLLLIGIGAVALIDSLILNKIFDGYIKEHNLA